MSDNVKRLVDLSIHYRGTVLHHCIILEDKITNYLAHAFISTFEQYKDIREIILDRLTFDAKIAAFEELIFRKYPEDFDKKYNKLSSELRYIRGVRNSVAHWPVFTQYGDSEKLPKEFSLVNFRDGAGRKVFHKGEFALFPERINKCVDVINELLNNTTASGAGSS